MPFVSCPGCGHNLPGPFETCTRCGWSRYRPSAATLSSTRDGVAVVEAPVSAFPLFPVVTHKFIVLTLCTLGLYELYWCYQNWKRINVIDRRPMRPFWRAFFAPLWGFALFGEIRDLATSEGVTMQWNRWVLGTLYLGLHITWRLPDPWWWLSALTFLPMIPVQVTAQRINARKAGLVYEDPNTRYSGTNVVAICLGGVFLLLDVVARFVPE